MGKDPRMTLPLDTVLATVSQKLPHSEYLVDRHSIEIAQDYLSVEVKAKWLPEYGTLSVTATFVGSAEQCEQIESNFDDEETKDDIDSGIGELLEEALKETYPKHDWECVIGEVRLAVKKKAPQK